MHADIYIHINRYYITWFTSKALNTLCLKFIAIEWEGLGNRLWKFETISISTSAVNNELKISDTDV